MILYDVWVFCFFMALWFLVCCLFYSTQPWGLKQLYFCVLFPVAAQPFGFNFFLCRRSLVAWASVCVHQHECRGKYVPVFFRLSLGAQNFCGECVLMLDLREHGIVNFYDPIYFEIYMTWSLKSIYFELGSAGLTRICLITNIVCLISHRCQECW